MSNSTEEVATNNINPNDTTSNSNILNANNTSANANAASPKSSQFGGIKSLIQHSNVLGNVILASETKSFEPLPFSDYSLFEDKYGMATCINLSLS